MAPAYSQNEEDCVLCTCTGICLRYLDFALLVGFYQDFTCMDVCSIVGLEINDAMLDPPLHRIYIARVRPLAEVKWVELDQAPKILATQVAHNRIARRTPSTPRSEGRVSVILSACYASFDEGFALRVKEVQLPL